MNDYYDYDTEEVREEHRRKYRDELMDAAGGFAELSQEAASWAYHHIQGLESAQEAKHLRLENELSLTKAELEAHATVLEQMKNKTGDAVAGWAQNIKHLTDRNEELTNQVVALKRERYDLAKEVKRLKAEQES